MRFYVDTSVWGGYGDAEFAEHTKPFFESAIDGKFSIVLSNITLGELENAPLLIRALPASIPEQFIEFVTLTSEHLELSKKYLQEGALPPKYFTDAQHIAMATILKVDGLVSWNFKHMVNFFRIRQYNSINLKYGYGIIDIRTPKEIVYGTE